MEDQGYQNTSITTRCVICRIIAAPFILRHVKTRKENPNYISGYTDGGHADLVARLHDDWTDLETSAASGCDFCILLRYECLRGKFVDIHPGLGPLELRAANGGIILFIANESAGANWSLMGGFASFWSIKEQIPYTFDVSQGSRIPTLVENWLSNCTDDHERCQEYRRGISQDVKTSSPFLPRRLLHVEKDRGGFQIKLIETANLPKSSTIRESKVSNTNECQDNGIRYVALSYCWGKNCKQLTTTKATLAAHLKRIEPLSLPKTVRDALELVCSIGITYLWVDALCIIQPTDGDSTDWEQQSGLMADIYIGSCFALMAENAVDVHQGLFSDRAIFKYPLRPCTFEKADLNIADKSEYEEEVVVRSQIPFFDNAIDSSPLSARAWTLQERILSSPALTITEHGMFWECGTWFASESDPVGVSQDDAYFREPALSASAAKPLIHSNWSTASFEELTSEVWEHLIWQYSRRRLTNQGDKLAAFCGVAKAFADTLTDDEYLAGVWRSDLPLALNWHCTFDQATSRREKDMQRRVPNLPTWTWMSCPYEVNSTTFTDPEMDWNIEILDANVQVSGNDPYTKVLGGEIVLRGPVADFYLNQSHWTPYDNGNWFKNLSTRSSTGLPDRLCFDELEELDRLMDPKSQPNFLKCFRLCQSVEGTRKDTFILLKSIASTDSSTFSRLGYYQIFDFQEYDLKVRNLKTLEITLV